jgi:hypothetical protein
VLVYLLPTRVPLKLDVVTGLRQLGSPTNHSDLALAARHHLSRFLHPARNPRVLQVELRLLGLQ